MFSFQHSAVSGQHLLKTKDKRKKIKVKAESSGCRVSEFQSFRVSGLHLKSMFPDDDPIAGLSASDSL